MNEELARAILAEVKRRDWRSSISPFFNALFGEQNAFIADPSKRKAAICSRRAGKSHSGAAYLSQEALDPLEGDVAYVGLTRGSAKKIMFQPLQRLSKKYNLGLEFNRSDLTATAPNGNTIYMTGAHTEDDTEKLRGLKFKLIILDECASFRAHLSYLIEEVLEPTLIDTNGTLALIGTPSANPGENYFYKATTDLTEGFSVHRWTILNNPYIPHAEVWLNEYRKRKGWDTDHPIYRREWLGEWTTDGDTLVYKYKRERNDFTDAPPSDLHYILGTDLGFNDAFTIAVLGYSESDRRVWVIEQYKKAGLIPAQMAEKLQEFRSKYNPISIVGDHGGLGKAICEEFSRRYHIPIKPAEKSAKMAAIEMCNGDLISGLIKIRDKTPLVSEMLMLQWDPDRPGKEDERTPNDLCDAFLYGYREAKHYLGEIPLKIPQIDTKEWADREAKRMLEQDVEQFNNQKATPWWEEA